MSPEPLNEEGGERHLIIKQTQVNTRRAMASIAPVRAKADGALFSACLLSNKSHLLPGKDASDCRREVEAIGHRQAHALFLSMGVRPSMSRAAFRLAPHLWPGRFSSKGHPASPPPPRSLAGTHLVERWRSGRSVAVLAE